MEPNGRGLRRLNLFLLKPFRFRVDADSARSILCVARSTEQWVQYEPRISEPLLQFLPTILARWIVENLFDLLDLLEPSRPRPVDKVYTDHEGREWTTTALNWVLQQVVVQAADGTHLAVFGAIEHESELYEGTPRIRCHNNFYGKARRVSAFVLLHRYSMFITLILQLLLYCYVVVCIGGSKPVCRVFYHAKDHEPNTRQNRPNA